MSKAAKSKAKAKPIVDPERYAKQAESLARWRAEQKAAKEAAERGDARVEQEQPVGQTLAEKWQQQNAAKAVKQADLTPRVDPASAELKAARREETFEKREDKLPSDVTAQRTVIERTPKDHSREVAVLAEEMRRERWRQGIEEDEARRGPSKMKNPRLPLMPVTQMFRAPDITEIPPDAVIPDGHAPKWVSPLDKLASGKESMVDIRAHQAFGYEIVKGEDERPIVTEAGVLMAAPYEAAARRNDHFMPIGSMRDRASSRGLQELVRETNRRAGRRVVDVEELPAHRRRFSSRLQDDD